MPHSQRPGPGDDWLHDPRESVSFDELMNGLAASSSKEDQPTVANPPTERQIATFQRLRPMLQAAHHEMSELSKKKPDGIVNDLKIRVINRLLIELRKLLENDPSRDFIELLDEESLPNNSDVVMQLSQWQSALAQYADRFYLPVGSGLRQWITVENPGPYAVQEETGLIPGFRSSGVVILDVIRANGRQEIVAVQVNTVLPDLSTKGMLRQLCGQLSVHSRTTHQR